MGSELLSWVDFKAIIACLPEDSALIRQRDPDSFWTLDRMLLASVVDELRDFQWLFASSKSKRKIPRPKPIPRPGVGPETKKHGAGNGLSMEEIDAWLIANVPKIA